MDQFERYSSRIHNVISKSKIVAMERMKVQVHFVFYMEFLLALDIWDSVRRLFLVASWYSV